MANTVPVKPEVLVWARESLGLSQEEAANILAVPLETLQAWENGAGFGITILRQIASKYKRPILALLQPEAPPLPPLPKDFRTVGGVAPSFSPETLLAIRDVQRIQEIAIDLLKDEPELFPVAAPSVASMTDAPELRAEIERRKLGITFQTQQAWQSFNTAFNAWRTRVQLQGILVLVKDMPREDCRGFSLDGSSVSAPIIVVNQQEADQAKIFTIFHEYAHLMLNEAGVCFESERVDHSPIERWCNQFAASLLVPRDRLTQFQTTKTPDLDDVNTLAWRFKVGRPTIALRLVELGLADRQLYEDLLEHDTWREPPATTATPTQASHNFGRRQEVMRLSELGIGFPTIVLNALRRRMIDVGEASDYLDMRPERFMALEEKVRSAIARYR